MFQLIQSLFHIYFTRYEINIHTYIYIYIYLQILFYFFI